MQFSEIQGQEKAIHILQCAIQNSHIAHAYLFTGPEGVGKKQTALGKSVAQIWRAHHLAVLVGKIVKRNREQHRRKI